jgi:hypothetical protein
LRFILAMHRHGMRTSNPLDYQIGCARRISTGRFQCAWRSDLPAQRGLDAQHLAWRFERSTHGLGGERLLDNYWRRQPPWAYPVHPTDLIEFTLNLVQVEWWHRCCVALD